MPDAKHLPDRHLLETAILIQRVAGPVRCVRMHGGAAELANACANIGAHCQASPLPYSDRARIEDRALRAAVLAFRVSWRRWNDPTFKRA